MRKIWIVFRGLGDRRLSLFCVLLAVLVMTSLPTYAQSPWEIAVTVLQNSFTGPIARG